MSAQALISLSQTDTNLGSEPKVSATPGLVIDVGQPPATGPAVSNEGTISSLFSVTVQHAIASSSFS